MNVFLKQALGPVFALFLGHLSKKLKYTMTYQLGVMLFICKVLTSRIPCLRGNRLKMGLLAVL